MIPLFYSVKCLTVQTYNFVVRHRILTDTATQVPTLGESLRFLVSGGMMLPFFEGKTITTDDEDPQYTQYWFDCHGSQHFSNGCGSKWKTQGTTDVSQMVKRCENPKELKATDAWTLFQSIDHNEDFKINLEAV